MTNEISVKGTLGADPELRYTKDGTAVATIRVADNTSKLNKQTNAWEQVGETIWWSVSIWNALGESVAEHLKKGDYVKVTGPVSFRQYEKDGEKRDSRELRATEISKPVTQKKGNGGGGNTNAGGGYKAPAQNETVVTENYDESPF